MVTPKTVRSLRRLIQGLFRDLDRLAKRRKATIRLVGRDKFIIESANPGHAFLVQFTPFFIGAQAAFPRAPPGQVESTALEPFHEAFHAVEAGVEAVQESVNQVMAFFEALQRQPRIFQEVLTSALFGTPGEFFEARRRERGG